MKKLIGLRVRRTVASAEPCRRPAAADTQRCADGSSAYRLRSFLVVVLLASLVAACGDSTKVGEGLTDVKDGPAGTPLGQTTTTTAPPSTTTTTVKGAPTTQRTTTTGPKQVTTAIKIQLNDPYYVEKEAGAFVGKLVRWTNTDSVARGVYFNDGSFGQVVQPGKSADYTPTRAGRIAYGDPERPYANGALCVNVPSPC